MLAPPNSVFGIFLYIKKIQTKDLKKSLLPPQVTYNNKIITAPAGWLPEFATETKC
jgi:hypothetical protein